MIYSVFKSNYNWSIELQCSITLVHLNLERICVWVVYIFPSASHGWKQYLVISAKGHSSGIQHVRTCRVMRALSGRRRVFPLQLLNWPFLIFLLLVETPWFHTRKCLQGLHKIQRYTWPWYYSSKTDKNFMLSTWLFHMGMYVPAAPFSQLLSFLVFWFFFKVLL